MAIKFICGCGKHLRARDEMASRRSVCPRCGAPVGIPSLRPTNPGTALGPMTPDERRRAARSRERPEDAAATPGTLPSPALVKGPTAAPQLLGPDAVGLAPGADASGLVPMQSPHKPARRPRWPLE